jgi:MFS family permease
VTISSKRPLAILIGANLLSWTGNTMTLVAVPLYVLDSSGSAAQAGLAGFANTLPLVIAGLAGGVVIDRIGAWRTSVTADLVAAVCMAAAPFLHSTAGLSIPVLMLLLFLRSLADAPGATARQALLPAAIEGAGARAQTANSLFYSGQRVALIIGPPAAAALAGVIGPASVLYIDAGTFAVSALAIGFAVPKTRLERADSAQNAGFVRELREGGRFIWATPLLATILSVVVVTNFVDDAFTPVLLPVYSKDVLHNLSRDGWLLTAYGVGAVAGTLIYAPASRRLLANRYLTFVGCFAAVAAVRVAMVALPGLWTVLALSFITGAAGGPLNPLITTLIQKGTPPELLGRVFGAVTAVAFAAAPLGMLVAGWITQSYGLRSALGFFAALYVALICYALVSRPLRRLRQPEAEPEAVPA